MADLTNVLFTASISFITLFIISKIMGKKQISQLDFVDYVVGISIGSIAAQMTVDNEIPYYHFILAMAVYMILDLMISFLSVKSITLKKLFRGKPDILIEDGKLVYKSLKKNNLDINEFLAMCRKKDYFDINDIAYCIYETNGQISILPKSHATPLISSDMNISKSKPALSTDLIIDGKIIIKALENANKTQKWLIDKLNSKNADLNNVAIATYNKQNDDIIIYYKNYEKS